MKNKVVICLRSPDEDAIINQMKNIFKKYKLNVNKNEVLIEKVALGIRNTIHIKLFNHKIDTEQFLKQKIKTYNYIMTNRHAIESVKRVLEIKYSKSLTFLVLKSDKKLGDRIKRKIFKLIRTFGGLLILDGRVFFDKDGCVLLDECGEYEYKNINSRLESEDLENFRFQAEMKVRENGYKIPKRNAITHSSEVLKSEEEIGKRILALLVNGVRAEQFASGMNVKDINAICRNVMEMFKVKRDWFTETELKFLKTNKPTFDQVESAFKGYAAIWALLFSIGIIKEFRMPLASGKYEDLLAVLKDAITLEEIMGKGRQRKDLPVYLNMAYISFWNSKKEIASELTAETININKAEMWYKALLWSYYNKLEWDYIITKEYEVQE